MSQTLLTAADNYHVRIRASIDSRLGEADLPDELIDQDNYIGEAVRRVVRVVPTAASLTGDSLEVVKNAAIWYAASRLCYVAIRATAISSQIRDSYSIQTKTYDPAQLSATLAGWADTALTNLMTDIGEEAGETLVKPISLSVVKSAKGKRGR